MSEDTGPRPLGALSVNPVSGYYTAGTAVDNFAIPQGLSYTALDTGFEQQTFLGASIRSFNVNAGFGDSVSTLNVELVNDEFNTSDGSDLGFGDDIYHSGKYDTFVPPPVGSPVFFKFGKQKATVSQAYYPLYNQIYGYTSQYDATPSGKFHFCFGGILQSYVENRGPGGDPLYSVQVVDPREVLSNVTLIMNDYAGSTYNTNNVYNLYGFLEYNPTLDQRNALSSTYAVGGSSILKKYVDDSGNYYFSGADLYYKNIEFNNFFKSLTTKANVNYSSWDAAYPDLLPITGTGFSRRGSNGIPYYRIRQALYALTGANGSLPAFYKDAGFSSTVFFRGFNYIVDFTNIPSSIPDFYSMDFNNINLLDFCLEICDITNCELFVSLLPIIDHPACKRFYNWNDAVLRDTSKNKKPLIAGIIRLDFIDKSFQPQYGTIKSYLDAIDSGGVPIENRDVGFELTNVSTDKFVVGAQEVDMYCFSTNNDRGATNNRPQSSVASVATYKTQWTLDVMKKQQVLPYYGMIDKAVTIPKGFGAYQQILLDASSLFAAGVGQYYVATEMELRAASVSYEKWAEFLTDYNDLYMESFEADDTFEGSIASATAIDAGFNNFIVELSTNYAVTVPRSVWPSVNDKYETDSAGAVIQGKVRTPVDSCNPPYGYPLYFKRAEKLGINGAGLTRLTNDFNRIVTDLAKVYGDPNSTNYIQYVNEEIKKLENFEKQSCGNLNESDAYRKKLLEAIKDKGGVSKNGIGIIQTSYNNSANIQKIISKLQKRTKENSLRVYNWLKKIADECLGKKFLVKIPTEVNLYYNKAITKDAQGNYTSGPFGFRPRLISVLPNFEYTTAFNTLITTEKFIAGRSQNMFEQFLSLDDGAPRTLTGALNVNFNPISEELESNYIPEPQGGYIDFDLMMNINTTSKQALAIHQGLLPIDMQKFMNSNRLQAYVRFDHSEDLAFDNLDSSDFIQQKIKTEYSIPDIAENFDNISDSFSFPQGISNHYNDPAREPSIAFVKCDLDDKLYFLPKVSGIKCKVHATKVIDIGQFPAEPRQRINPETCECESLLELYRRNYIPDPDIDSSDVNVQHFHNTSGIIHAKLQDLDTNNAYALITLPSKIMPKKDRRFVDGPMSEINPTTFKHLLSMDVVKIPHFEKPRYISKPPTSWVSGIKSSLSPSTLVHALNATKVATQKLQFGFPQKLQFIAPSPVYPDLVVLPLRSNERCYGPWVSSLLDSGRYVNLGGKIEFIKDENLSPWNYNGYDLMNQAGQLQAVFSNSRLLQSERGGAVVPAAPSGIYLGKYLQNVGPLLTNLSVDVSDNGIKTTFKFDLYSVSFGKLVKYKQDQISNISRERQKMRDERNSLIRKNLGKSQSSISFTRENNILSTAVENLKPNITNIIYSSWQEQTRVHQNKTEKDKLEIPRSAASMSNPDDVATMASNLEQDDLMQKINRSASSNISDIFIGVDQSPAPNPYLTMSAPKINTNVYYNQ